MATIPSGTKFLGVDPAFTDLTEKKGTKVDRKSEYFTLEDITATIGAGSQGPQGVQGPAGPVGPVGPAGLEWRGAWNTNTSYAVDDAVGFNGSSWFCISAVTGTGNSNPEIATTKWALLASQGAQGIQGVQGPTGPQGAGATQTLQQTVDLGNTITNGGLTSSLSATQLKIADSSTTGITISSRQITSKGDGGIVLVNFPASVSGGTKVLTVRDLSGTVVLTRDLGITNTTTSALSLSTLNSTYTSYFTGFKVFCPNITGGGLVYLKTGTSTWSSQPITEVV